MSKSNILNTPFLVIVESPSKCIKIEKYLGFQYKCIASKGHIREIKKVTNYEPIFEIIPEKKSHVTTMRTIISQHAPENIYLATDDDREGEAISWHICQVFNLSVENTHRILFHEITEHAIQAAVCAPIKIRMNIVYAQLTRQVLDRLVGFKLSPILSKRLGARLSAGRCQTPALRLIYDKEMLDVPMKYKTTGYFFSAFPLEFHLNHDFQKPEECIEFLKASKEFKHEFTKDSLALERKMCHMDPPKPFNTSELLQSASTGLHYSPKQTMMYCQTLYQNGHITYMRTESQKYASIFLSQMRDYISESNRGDFSRLEINSINPHEAIRVTNIYLTEVEKENTLYQWIWKNTLASCMHTYDYYQIDLKITAPISYYKFKIEIPYFLGWKSIMTEKYKEMIEKQTQIYSYLSINKKPKLQKIKMKMTRENRHYTESGLIKKLEEYGIGRPSTYALLVDTIQNRGYVKKTDLGEKIKCTEYEWQNGEIICNEVEKIVGNEKNKLVLQELGKQAIEFLVPNYETIFSYDYTRRLEEQLDEIAKGAETRYELCKGCDSEMVKCSTVYEIDDEHVFMFGKNGGMIKCTDGTIKSAKQNIDIMKLREKQYTLQDLLETECLGNYKGNDILLKNGPYGAYLEWGNKKKSVKKSITFEKAIPYLEELDNLDKNVIRVLRPDLSIKRGKYGPYLFFTENGKSTCHSLKHFRGGYKTCDPEILIKWMEG